MQSMLDLVVCFALQEYMKDGVCNLSTEEAVQVCLDMNFVTYL